MGSSANSTVSEVLSQTADAADQVKSVSNELEVVHAVLSTEMAAEQVNVDVLAAVERTDELAQQLAETAEALENSTEMLRKIKADADRTTV